jgi:hypothetical protein
MRGLGICPWSEFASKSPMSSCRSVVGSLSVYFLTSLAWVQSRGHTLICDSPLVMVVVMLHFSKSSPFISRPGAGARSLWRVVGAEDWTRQTSVRRALFEGTHVAT